jgi:uncharacterized protein (DUF2236 family)
VRLPLPEHLDVARVTRAVATVRESMADTLRRYVVGPDGEERARALMEAPGERWYAEDRPIRRVHADASMFIGGLRALLLQSLHPLAMAGVAQHSDYRTDPWGRLQRTADFLAVTTFGPAEMAERTIARIRDVHSRVVGTAPDGRPYSASDPHLLKWVHVAEVESFLVAHQRFGERPLDQAGCDGYVADMAHVAEALGVERPPRTERELGTQLRAYKRELRSTRESRDAARYLLLTPPLDPPARAAYALLAAATVATLPAWARIPLRLPLLPVTERLVLWPLGAAITAGLRWVTSPSSPYRVDADSRARETNAS